MNDPKPLSWSKRAAAFAASWVIRLVSPTLRIQLTDETGIVGVQEAPPVIWCVWHNRIFALPWWQRTLWKKRPMCVLTSPSGDGGMIAAVCGRFGIDSARGSSNKRGARALKELCDKLRDGVDVTITPDGPRGPRYVVAPGIVTLGALTKRPVVPVHFIYEKAWRLKTWDGFYIPKPFSKVTAKFCAPIQPVDDSEEELALIQAQMRGGLGGDETGIGVVKEKRRKS